MIVLTVAILVAIFVVDYFAVRLGVIPHAFTLIPDVIAVVIAVLIIGRALVLKKWEQPKKYLWLVLAMVLTMTVGLVAQNVSPGVVVAGIRSYFKYLPLLFLPAIYCFSRKDLNLLIGVFLFFACIQVPLAFYQRFVQFAERMHTGDPVTGTVSTSSSLTVILCVAIALIMTLYVQRKIRLTVTMILLAFLASPTTINETKATILLLPLAIIGPFLLTFRESGKWRKLVPVLAICVLASGAYVVTYNAMKEFTWEGKSIDDFLMSGRVSWYLYRGAEVGSDDSIGRIDSIILPVEILSDQWMQLLFGVGIGNASPSFVGLDGAYYEQAKAYGFGRTAIGNLIWESGLTGLVIYALFFFWFFRDARVLARSETYRRWLGTWWSVSVLIFFLALGYKPILVFNETAYFLFLWAGIIASKAWELKREDSLSEVRVEPSIVLAGRQAPAMPSGGPQGRTAAQS